MRTRYSYILVLFLTACNLQEEVKPLEQLKVSSNGRFFQTADGKPFFWLGDTGWLLFEKCNRENAIKYLDTRQQQGFNVVQVMVLHELNIHKNAYGDSAIINIDVSRPKTTPGNDPADVEAYDYWDHVDFIINEAEKRGIYMALVPVWGSDVKAGKVNAQQAAVYAKFLAERYRNKSNIIWLNGGDIKGSDSTEVWNTIGNTIKQYDHTHLAGYHPRGRTSSSDWFHNEKWLDFNMFQSGHRDYSQDTSSNETNHYGESNWRYVNADYQLMPVKPTFDGEPSYENIPHGLHDSLQPRWTAMDIRRYAYWSVFAGGAGITYGENAVMQFHHMGDFDFNYGVNQEWEKTVNAPGAQQIHYIKELMLSTDDYFDRVPAQDILADNTGTGYDYLIATKGKKYAMVYTYARAAIRIDITRLGFTLARASWYDPSTGKRTNYSIGEKKKIMEFNTPGKRENGSDWVLILQE